MSTSRKVKDEINLKKWLQGIFMIKDGDLTLKPKDAWTKSEDIIKDDEAQKSCPGGCLNFSKRGSNAYVDVRTCKVCGKQTITEKEIMETRDPAECPHEILDYRGSPKKTSRTFCLQC
jgi:hypothetical protein